jgi:hypothetical protein
MSLKLLALGELPVDWKNGVVTAIYKKGVKSDMGNYRPVSLESRRPAKAGHYVEQVQPVSATCG